MATQYNNKATSEVTVGGSLLQFESNVVTSELLDNTSISLEKTQNLDLVVSGGSITYTITITNNINISIPNLNFTDIIPTGMTYTADTFKVGGVAATPTVEGQNLSYSFLTLPTGVTVVTFDCTVI